MAEKLNTGDSFPSMTVDLVGGGSFSIPNDLEGAYNVVLFYRGHW
ncbi:MAG: hypothetical protein QGH73_04640 [Rhodospirillales bacterium]|jgi:hypothetical protein|nr:hypothetical protein [Rhodospirillales bacterium]MDP6646646.1 hypothetical protein [Rhodospirillales bacterium]MDP6840943.1 hypothetical protein [Rhodospirillales bacterium]|tara:strand:- start:1267 stop:1401 length:135 start_codon:yes stop_codon:yes gene_type:complete